MQYVVEVKSKVEVIRTEQFEVEADSPEEAKELYTTGEFIEEFIESENTLESKVTGVWDENGNPCK